MVVGGECLPAREDWAMFMVERGVEPRATWSPPLGLYLSWANNKRPHHHLSAPKYGDGSRVRWTARRSVRQWVRRRAKRSSVRWTTVDVDGLSLASSANGKVYSSRLPALLDY